MTLHIVLSEESGDSRAACPPSRVQYPAPSSRPDPPLVDLGDPAAPPMLLYLADEPEIGRRFSYGGAVWEVVDYQDGWIARLLVAP